MTATTPWPFPIHGVLAPVLTPFTAALAPDPERFNRHCAWLLANGCAGLAVFGTNSEANSLGLEERRSLLEGLVASGVDPSRLLPGTGCCAGVDGVDKLATLLMRGGLSE